MHLINLIAIESRYLYLRTYKYLHLFIMEDNRFLAFAMEEKRKAVQPAFRFRPVSEKHGPGKMDWRQSNIIMHWAKMDANIMKN